MINVCHISTMTNWGGVELMLVDMLTTVKQQHIRHFLLTTSSSSKVLNALKDTKIEFFEPSREFHYDPRAIFQMVQWLREKKIDIVHTYNLRSNCWGGVAALLAGTPIRIAGEHGSVWLPDNLLTRIEKQLNKTANLVIANSVASKTMLSAGRKIPVEKIQVIRNAVQDPEACATSGFDALRKEFSLSVGTLVVGTVGRLSASKDLFTWLDIAKILADMYNNVQFIIVGDGPLAGALRQYASTLGILPRVIFAGWRQDAREIIQLFDVYLCSSIHESFGNTLLEAAFCKKPVVAPRIDGIPEAIVDGKTGLLVTPDTEIHAQLQSQHTTFIKKVVIDGKVASAKSLSPGKTAQIVSFLLNDPGLCRTLGETAYIRAIEEFSIQRYVRDLEAVYSSLYTSMKHDNT